MTGMGRSFGKLRMTDPEGPGKGRRHGTLQMSQKYVLMRFKEFYQVFGTLEMTQETRVAASR